MKKENIKQKNSKMIAGAAALTAIIAIAGIAASTYAYRGDFNEGGASFDSERHTAMIEAFENNDYDAWLELTGDKPVADKITAANFSKFVDMHNLMKEGKYEEAKVIRDELGLEGMGKQGKRGLHERRMMEKNKEALTALDDENYDAWLTAIPEDCPARELVTEDKFPKLIEAHNLMKNGDFEGAKEIREELGLKVRAGGHGPRGMNRSNDK